MKLLLEFILTISLFLYLLKLVWGCGLKSTITGAQSFAISTCVSLLVLSYCVALYFSLWGLFGAFDISFDDGLPQLLLPFNDLNVNYDLQLDSGSYSFFLTSFEFLWNWFFFFLCAALFHKIHMAFTYHLLFNLNFIVWLGKHLSLFMFCMFLGRSVIWVVLSY